MNLPSPRDIDWRQLAESRAFHFARGPRIESEDLILGLKEIFLERLELSRLERCQKRAEFFSIPNAVPADYAEDFKIFDHKKILVRGIRFRNQAKNFPFVDLWGHLDLSTSDAFRVQLQESLQRFAKFSPRGVCVKLPTEEAETWLSRGEIWDHYLVAPLPLKASQSLASLGLSLRKEKQARVCYTHYEREYSHFLRVHPEFKSFLRLESPEDFEVVAQNALLWSLYFRDQWAGCIAIRDKKFFGREGAYIFEKFIPLGFQRRGWGKAFEGAVLQELFPRFDFVWGSINSKNIASLRSSLAQGRISVMQELFLPTEALV